MSSVHVGLDALDANSVVTAAARLLPPSLAPFFDARFTRSHLLFDEYVYRLTLEVFAAAGLDGAVSEWGAVEEVVKRAGLDPRASPIPVDWMLRHLARRGAVSREDGRAGARFRSIGPLPALLAAPVVEEQRALDPASLPSYVLAETAARDYPAFLRGDRSGDDILFTPTRLTLWVNYFSNDNALYAINNKVGAVAVETWMPRRRSTILELGGGLGSGTLSALDRLAAAGRLSDLGAYRFTELVPAFLRRAERVRERLPDSSFLTFAPLDMNRAFVEQGVEPASVSVVYAVNTLHVAHDLAFTLGEIARALEPGGQLIVSECIRPAAGDTLYPEFVFNLLETFRAPRLHPDYRPTGGFLTPEQWTAALHAAGFVDVRLLPDIARIRAHVPNFYVAAVGATRR